MKKYIKMFADIIYSLEVCLILPVVLKIFPPRRFFSKEKDVLHTAYLSTKPRIICQSLRKNGISADYMAFTHFFSNSRWLKADEKAADFIIDSFLPLSCFQFFGELFRFYRLILKYKVIHCHSLRFPSSCAWELPLLKKLGVKIVIHYRGCDIRDPDAPGMKKHRFTACSECDYPDLYCRDPQKNKLRKIAEKYGDVFLVTTPDLLEFSERAVLFPFFAPILDTETIVPKRSTDKRFEIVHATNHEGIDGTEHIRKAVERLNEEGLDVGLNIMKRLSYNEALCFYKGATLAIGKLCMGYYANSQIESIMLGTPTAFWVRDDLKKYLNGLEIINICPDNVYEVLKEFLENPAKLAETAERQQAHIRRIHDNDKLSSDLKQIYGI